MWAVVPLKSPERAKSRLAGVLNAAQRRQLLFTLAERMIGALRATPGIDAVAVVTASAEVAAFAQRLGAHVMAQPREDGTAAAFSCAVNALRSDARSGLLMIAGDLPLVSVAALERLVAAGATAEAVIVPDRHRVGTNALLCTPPHALAPQFGADSFARHLAAAARARVDTRVLEIAALNLDLDSADDLAELQGRDGADPLLSTCASAAHEAPQLACAR